MEETAEADRVGEGRFDRVDQPGSNLRGDRSRGQKPPRHHVAAELARAGFGRPVADGQVQQVLSAVFVDALGHDQCFLHPLGSERFRRPKSENSYSTAISESSRETKAW